MSTTTKKDERNETSINESLNVEVEVNHTIQ